MKIRDIVYGAFRLIQVTSQGEETSETSMENEAMLALQTLLDSWSARKLLQFTTVYETFDLQTGKNQYTVGPLADFDTQNPEYLTAGYIHIPNSNLDISLQLISEEDYFNIFDKTFQTYPKFLFFKLGYPTSTIELWPVPSVAGITLSFASYKKLIDLNTTDINSEINLPASYARALKFNLAMELAPEYSIEPSQYIISSAQQSLDSLIRLSQKKIPQTVFDAALQVSPNPYQYPNYRYWGEGY